MIVAPVVRATGINPTDEWYDVESLSDHSWRIREGGLFGCYLVTGDDRALVIDAGVGVGDLPGVVSELVDVPPTVLLTHSHWDHIGAAPDFEDVRIHSRERTADGRVPVDGGTDGVGYGPADWIADWQAAGRSFPDGFDPDAFAIEPVTGVTPIEPGATVDLGGRRLELHHVPGHSPGQLAVLDRTDGALYGGDVVHNDHALYIHFGGCDIRAYQDTFSRLTELRDSGAFDTLHLSHAPSLSGGALEVLDEFRTGLAAILADELDYEAVDDSPPARRYEIAGNEVLTKPNVT